MQTVSLGDSDGFADCLHKEVRLDGTERPSVYLVAKRWGVRVFAAPSTSMWSELGQRVRVRGEERIYIRSAVEGPLRAVIVGHELGHIALDRWHLDAGADLERWCWRFGAALLCPAAAVRRAWRIAGGDLGELVQRWPEAPPTALALRVAEVEHIPTWIMQGREPRYRYAPEPSADVFAAANEAQRCGRAVRPGLRAVRLSDAVRRAAVLLERVG